MIAAFLPFDFIGPRGALETLLSGSDYDLSHDALIEAAVIDGWTVASADAMAAEEIAARDARWEAEAASEQAAEAGYEYWLETRYSDQMMAEPEWAR